MNTPNNSDGSEDLAVEIIERRGKEENADSDPAERDPEAHSVILSAGCDALWQCKRLKKPNNSCWHALDVASDRRSIPHQLNCSSRSPKNSSTPAGVLAPSSGSRSTPAGVNCAPS